MVYGKRDNPSRFRLLFRGRPVLVEGLGQLMDEMVGLLARTAFHREVDVELGTEHRRQPVFIHHVHEKVMVQHLGDAGQQLDIDAGPVENGIDVGPLAVDLPRELRNRHVLLVENNFDLMSDMKLVFHISTPN